MDFSTNSLLVALVKLKPMNVKGWNKLGLGPNFDTILDIWPEVVQYVLNNHLKSLYHF